MDEDWISITEAAARLTRSGDVVTRSTLSRYLGKHSDALPTRKDGRSSLVNYIALRAHRKENIRIDLPSGVQPAEAIGNGAKLGEPEASSSGPKQAFAGTRVDGASRKALADAELKEMDLAERRKQLTPTAEVDRAGRDAIALMKSSFERAVEGEAASLSVRYGWDERAARLALKDFARIGLDAFHRELLNRLDRFSRTDAEPDDNTEAEIEAQGGPIADG